MDPCTIGYMYYGKRQDRLVEPDEYGYIEMVYDVYNSVLSHIPTGKTLSFNMKCISPGGEDDMPLRTEKDIFRAIARHPSNVDVLFAVYDVQVVEHPTSTFTINGFPSSIIKRENQPGRHWMTNKTVDDVTSMPGGSGCNFNARAESTSTINVDATNSARPKKATVRRGGATCKISSRSASEFGTHNVKSYSTTECYVEGSSPDGVRITSMSDAKVEGNSPNGGRATCRTKARVDQETYTFDDSSDDEWKDGSSSSSGEFESSDDVFIDEVTERKYDSDHELSDYNFDMERNENERYEVATDPNKVRLDGMVFRDVHHYRSVLHDFVIQGSFEIIMKKNEPERVTAICKVDHCPWQIHTSLRRDEINYMVKSFNPVHNYNRVTVNRHATSTWIAKTLSNRLKADPNMSSESMSSYLKEQFGIDAHPKWLYRARKTERELHEGSHAKSYRLLPKYGRLILETNPGTDFKLQFEDRHGNFTLNPVFKRVFVCFDACKKGFIRGCRPFIGIDGCYLKGTYGGILLAVVALDGNNGFFPLAFGVVETESNDSWLYFLNCLYDSLYTTRDHRQLTFMSDKQNGLSDAISDTFPDASQRHYGRHIYNKFKVKYRGAMLKAHFWATVRASNQFFFQKAMTTIKDLNSDAHDCLMKAPPSMWSRHAFDHAAKSDNVTNNMTESFNQWINPYRGKTIFTLIDQIRVRLMSMMYSRYEKGCSYRGGVTPRMRKRLDAIQDRSMSWVPVSCGNQEFEVYDGNYKFVVNLREKSCECKEWEASGLPCRHAVAAISFTRGKLEDFCDEYFTPQKYVLAYSDMIHPMPDITMLVGTAEDEIELQPPALKRLRGRPPKNRRPESGEAPCGDYRKRSGTVKCGRCKQLGHNVRKCQRAPVKKKGQPKQRMIGGNDITVSQSTMQPSQTSCATTDGNIARTGVKRKSRTHGQTDPSSSQVETRSQCATTTTYGSVQARQREINACRLARMKERRAAAASRAD